MSFNCKARPYFSKYAYCKVKTRFISLIPGLCSKAVNDTINIEVLHNKTVCQALLEFKNRNGKLWIRLKGLVTVDVISIIMSPNIKVVVSNSLTS